MSQVIDPLPLVIIGLRFGAEIIEKHFTGEKTNPHFTLRGVFDLEAAMTARWAEKTKTRAYESFDEILADDSVRAVGLFTPPAGRAGLIRKIIRAGKDVMTTKPFELDAEAAGAVLEEARRLGRVVHLNSPPPSPSPDILQIRKWQTKQDLGRLVGAYGEVYASYQEKADGSWYDDPERCPLAPLFRLGIYMINDFAQLIDDPVEVRTLHSRVRTGRPTPDNAQMSIRYAGGAIASIYSSFCVADGESWRNACLFHFEGGTIFRDLGPHREEDGAATARLTLIQGKEKVRTREESVVVPCGAHGFYRWDWLHDAIHGHPHEPAYPIDTILHGIRVIDAMARSTESGGALVSAG